MASATKRMKIRLLIVVGAMAVIGLGWVIGNLAYRSLVTGEDLKVRAAEQQLSDITIPANRGTIYDTNMNVLAQSATVWNVQLSPLEILKYQDEKERAEMVADLAELLELDPEKIKERLERTTSQYEIIKRRIEKPTADALNELMAEKGYIGIYLEIDTKRYYPYNQLASNVIGFTNAENQGAYGLEAKYNSVLSGTPGRKISAKNALGETIPTSYEKLYPASEGNSIVTTIDQVIQHYIETAIEATVAQHKPTEGAAAIVMNVKTGAILGMASYPNFDLNDPYTILDEDMAAYVASITDEEARSAALKEAWEKQWRNKTITDTYEPGSVFKTVTASAALEEGTATLNSTYTCTGSVKLPGLPTPMHCHKRTGHGTLDFTGALVNSCNPAFIAIGSKLGAATFFKYFDAFGLTEKTGIDLPAENKGTYYDASMSAISLASCSFGQSNTVTPMQMLTAAVATINGGNLLTPYVVEKVIDSDGNTVEEYGPVVRRQVISEETSAIMRQALEAVVSHNGGTNAYVKGYRIGGKSGTSQKLTDDTDTKRVFSYFVFAPADDPVIAALVMVDEATSGETYANVVAGPLAAAIMADTLPYLGITPQYTEEELASQEITVPTGMIDMDVLSAESKLRAAGLSARIVGSGKTVASVYPSQLSKVPQGSTIVLYTEEDATEMVSVPDVSGKTPKQANQILTNAGLNIRFTGGAANNTAAKVASQSLEAGSEVPRGTIIEVECLVAGEDGE
ncbi:MAG: penicillin-binding transpeptidase domain-containing protein [Anaerotruncus rubiinfantis]|jgi:stage V sporulation protein D (sporulation-specific penicillin-binding protein)